MDKTPPDGWIASRISEDGPREHLSRSDLDRYHLENLRGTIEYARTSSPFYRRHLAGAFKELRCLEDLRHLPFTTSEHIQEKGTEFLCVSQSLITEAMTRRVRGASKARRLYFTAEDLEKTVDFYQQAMSTFVRSGGKVLVLVADAACRDASELQTPAVKLNGSPCPLTPPTGGGETEIILPRGPALRVGREDTRGEVGATGGSPGDSLKHACHDLLSPDLCNLNAVTISRGRKCRQAELLVQALGRMNAQGIVRTAGEAVEAILSHDVDCVAGVPVQLQSVVAHEDAVAIPYGKIKNVLITSDRVAPTLAALLERIWGSRIYNHYGTVEMGLAGGIECRALQGYHLRETDLYFEIVEPLSGEPLPPGGRGEIVFTTLKRRGMPLIRYRTGDLSRFLREPCPCGSALKRLERVQARL